MSYFNSRYLKYETNTKINNLDYGVIATIITDRLVNVNMGGSGYVLEAVQVAKDYIPRLGDWVTVEWQNGNAVINGGTGVSTGLQNINEEVKIISTTDMAPGVVSSDHIRTNTIEARHITASTIQANHISANAIETNHIKAGAVQAEQISANAIQAQHISANAIKASHIEAGAIQAGHISASSITASHISANAIQSSHIGANTVQANHISANAIQAKHITADAVNATHISANSIATKHLQSNSIQTQHLSANSVTATQISANSVQAMHIASDQITAQHISANSVQTKHITAGAVVATHISANAVQTQHISANSISGGQIMAGAVKAVNIDAWAIQAQHISANAIQTQHISANTITAGHLNANSVNATHIVANSVKAVHVDASAIQAQHISANAIQTQHVSANTIETKHIKALAITAELISANAVNAVHVKADAIQASHISANSVQTKHITASAIQAQHISANAIQTQHLSANSIEAKHLKAGSITADLISANAVNATHISANAIQSQHISTNALQAKHISANAVQTQHISANSINAGHVQASAVQAQHISANAVQAGHISANSIQGKHIVGESISANHIAAQQIDTDHLTVGSRKEGLLAHYFTYANGAISKFQTFKGHQIDPNINFSWGTGSPAIVGQADYFSVRWQGFILAPETGAYDFHIIADDAAKLVVDNKVLVNQTAYANLAEQTGTVSLVKGNWYPIMVEYSEGVSTARIELRWTKPSLVKEIIPSKYFTQGNTVIDGATITTGSIVSTSIKAGTITAESGIIADATIQSAHIASGSITAAKIGTAEIRSVHIASGNIQNVHIADATINHAKIQSMDAAKITVGKLVGDQIAAGSIIGSHISGSVITGEHISANTIDSIHIRSGAISADEISAGAITASKLETGAITSDSIRAGSISAHHISTVGLDAQQITVYNGATGETLIGSGFLRVDGLDVGVVRSDNLLANGLFLTASSAYGIKRENKAGETIAGTRSNGVGGHKIWKIDMTTGERVAEIDVAGKKPYDIAIHPSGNHAYVTVQGDNTLMQIDLANDIIGQTLSLPHGPARIKWTGTQLKDHKHFFILNTDEHDHNIPDALTVVDAPPDSVGSDLYLHHNIALGNNPVDFIIDSNKQAYITMGTQGDIVQIDMTGHDSSLWKVVGRIPITAYGTDVYHGGLDGTFGLNEVTGGDASAQYNRNIGGASGHTSHGHAHGGYGAPDGTMKDYDARGIAQSADANTLYVVDRKNGEIVVVDKMGQAPYNALTGATNFVPIDSSGHEGHGGGTMEVTSNDGSVTSPADIRNAGESHGGGPGTYYVRYRIPVGDKPEFIQSVDGHLVVTLQGSNEIAMIDEAQILAEIQADREYYGNYLGEGIFEKWNPFVPMRQIGTISVHNHDIGSKPTMIDKVGNRLFVTLSGQNQVVEFDMNTMAVVSRYNTGANPRGFAITPDGRYMYVANHGGVGELSFVYTDGPFIGDAFFGLEGGIVYQGAEYWTPDRSNWTYDASGNVKSYSTVEFRVNEPFLNEGGYAKLTAYGNDYQYALIEQDIYNVTNFSNGNNVVRYEKQRLLGNSGNTIFYPSHEEWQPTPAPSNIRIVEMLSGNRVEKIPATNKYSIFYGESSRIEFSGGTVTNNQWVEADYTSRYNQYFEPHNGSVLIAVENGSSPNFNTVYEIDEYVPKFVVWDNQQTSNFTPVADGVNEEYAGLEYSLTTNRAKGRTTVTASKAPASGALISTTDGDHMTKVTLAGGLSYVQVDLGKKYMIGKLNIVHHHETTVNNRKYKQTKTQVSEDGITWTTVYDSAVSGEYFEYAYHPEHDHYHMGKPIFFPARPVRYVRDYANGWTEAVTGLTGTDSHWTEIEAFGDWEFIENKVYPANSEKAGQQIATNGRGFVATDISKAQVAFNVAIEFTSWWYMTYIVGPEYGDVSIEMPTVMGGSHFLPQDGMYVNNIAHRHIMAFPPSQNIKADATAGIEAGKHRIVIKQESGRVTLDRIRLEDYQYYKRNSVSIPPISSSTTFRRHRKVAEEAKWYEGKGLQSTEGAYDKPRTNIDTGLPDKSVPIKYRIRVRSELNANGTAEERGITYITSAIFETGKQHTHWRPSAASDSYPGTKIESWDANQPHKTGIQSHHLAHGSVKGPKIMTGAIMDYHVSNYARISEHKLDLNHPTHGHGRMLTLVGVGPMGTDVHQFVSNKDILDAIEGWGTSGTANLIARADHTHNYLPLSGGTVAGSLTLTGSVNAKGLISTTESKLSNGTFTDPHAGTSYGLKVSQGIATDKLYVSGNLTITGTVDGVDIAKLKTDFDTHIAKPNAPTALSLSESQDFVQVSFTLSTTPEVEEYEVWSSVGNANSYGMIAKVHASDIAGGATTLSVVDSTYNRKTTVYYKVFAVRGGRKSDALTGNIVLARTVADPSSMSVIADVDSFLVQYTIPSDRRLSHVEIRVDKQVNLQSLAEANGNIVYSGLAERFTYPIPESDYDKYHQFWVTSITRS